MLYKLFEKKNADAHYKRCVCCKKLYKLFEKFYELFEKKNADAHYKKLFKLFPVVHVVWEKERGCHSYNSRNS